MAKGSGETRCSNHVGNPYHVNGKRLEYKDLPESNKRTIVSLKNRYSRGMRERLRDKTVELDADGVSIDVGFNRRGIDHVVQDAMMKLSGKYFSKDSLYRINEILAKSTYLPTSHSLYKARKDGT